MVKIKDKLSSKKQVTPDLLQVIRTHPAVADVAVFGRPDPVVQELVTGLVLLKPGQEATEGELVKLVEERLDDHQRLRGGVKFVQSPLPRNATGKILRRNLNELYKSLA